MCAVCTPRYRSLLKLPATAEAVLISSFTIVLKSNGAMHEFADHQEFGRVVRQGGHCTDGLLAIKHVTA